MYVSEYIAHLGDGNTAVRFLDDALQFNAGGVAMMKLTEGSADVVTINPDSADVNFQVNGDTVANLLFVDAGASNVGIGTSSPADKLTVNGNIGLFGNKIYNGSASNSAGIDFGDSQVDLHGYNGIRFFASTAGIGSMTERMRIVNNGNVLIGTTTDSGYKLNVNGTAYASGILVSIRYSLLSKQPAN